MTHSPDFGAETRQRKLAPTSGLCVVPIWHQIFLVPDSGAGRCRSVACSILCRFPVCSCPLRRPVIERNVLYTMSWLLITITSIDEMDSSSFASSMLIFGADIFLYQIASGTKKSAPKLDADFQHRVSAPISGVCILSFRRQKLGLRSAKKTFENLDTKFT